MLNRRAVIRLAKFACLALGLAAVAQAASAAVLGPAEWRGHLGYYYRMLHESGMAKAVDTSHQLVGSVNTSTYLWQPWLATTSLSLTFTQDSSTYETDLQNGNSNSQILTGDWGLNVIPQSSTPFNARVLLTDSSVTRDEIGQTPITFVGEHYSSRLLTLRQSYRTGAGGRYQGKLDLRKWSSDNRGNYDDKTYGLEADVRRARQHLLARATHHTTQYEELDRKNESTILDVSHFFYPFRNFRVDSKVSKYNYDRSFLDPSVNDVRLTNTQISQASSFAFWRPKSVPLTVSGGVRVFTMDGTQDSLTANDQTQIAVNGGAFYQANKHLRLDGAISSTFADVAGVNSGYHRQHVGGLYQSDWKHPFGMMYQWYINASGEHRADPSDSYIALDGGAGHNLSHTWFPGERTDPTSFRLNINQAIGMQYSGAVAVQDAGSLRLDHSVTLAYSTDNQAPKRRRMDAQVTASDSRYSSDALGERQLVNFQAGVNQELSLNTNINGDVTFQYVRQSVGGGSDDTTTASARIKFEHLRMLGVPRLRFVSDLMFSNVSTDGAVNRADWENAVNYSIGMLETSASYRITDADEYNYDLVYFRVMRRF